MWGTDGVRVFTAEDGWVWTFAAVDHWNAECVGWHVCKVGSRFAALEPLAQGLGRRYGAVEADVARGLALRMDHGSQNLSDHFLNQLRYWGIHPSFGFVEEPETNGVVERWNRTLKEQAVYGRVFHNRGHPSARRRRCVRRTLQPVLAPRKAVVSHATRSARAIRATPCRVAQTCVQETGCGTGRDVFPVDGHSFRIFKRTGVLGDRSVYRRRGLHDGLQDAVDGSRRKPFHINLAVHGQRTCLPRRPRCSSCAARSIGRMRGVPADIKASVQGDRISDTGAAKVSRTRART